MRPDLWQQFGFRDWMRQAVFVNTSQQCYFLGVVKGILWLCQDMVNFQVTFGMMLSEIFSGAIHSRRNSVLWEQPSWQAVLSSWREPHRQHDAGEFLSYFAGQCPSIHDACACEWQALHRGFEDDAWIIAERSELRYFAY